MSDFLAGMSEASLGRVRAAKARVGEAELLRRASARERATALCRHGSGFDVLAEIKLRSPSRGTLLSGTLLPASERAAAYAQAGAFAVSVVTEPSAFSGSLETLDEISSRCELPTLRKDFLVDPYQVIEARAHGASGVLLIVRILPGALLLEMLAAADALGMFVIVEVFEAEELERAVTAVCGARGSALVGVNARDLTTLSIDRSRHAACAHRVPAGVALVAESGIATPADAARVAGLGYGAALVGEALMRAADPRPLLSSMIASGREATMRREVTR